MANKHYTEEQRAKIVQRVLNGEKHKEVAKSVGCSEKSIRDWQKKMNGQPRVITYQAGESAETYQKKTYRKKQQSAGRAMLFVGSPGDLLEVMRGFQ